MTANMTQLIKLLYWDLSNSSGKFNYINLFLRSIPGNFGIELRRIILPRYFKSCGENLRCHDGVRFRNIDKICAGDNFHLGTDCFLQGAGGILIGNDVLLGPGVKIWSDNHVYEDLDVPIHSQGYDYKEVSIGDNVWIGANAFIMPGAVIGSGSIISAGSVVGGKIIQDHSILAGNPARKIGSRMTSNNASSEVP